MVNGNIMETVSAWCSEQGELQGSNIIFNSLCADTVFWYPQLGVGVGVAVANEGIPRDWQPEESETSSGASGVQ